MRSLLLDLVVPTRCAGCGAAGTALCAFCGPTLRYPFPVARPGLPPAWALAVYSGPARRVVLACKERGRRELAVALGRALAEALPTLPPIRAGPVILVPAPSRPAAARKRGGQHMHAVARHCAAALARRGRAASVAPALRLSRKTRDSVGLSPEARAANLAGRVRHVPRGLPPPGTGVVLLDDVITTGATAIACASALAATGVRVVAVLACTATVSAT